jgi:hypothetical protein
VSGKLKKSALRKLRIKRLLGEAYSTANNKLIKKLMFYFIDKSGEKCYRCGEAMTEDDWSIEHKSPWLYSDDPKGNFFSFDNIAFSHKNCNYDDSRKSQSRDCPSITAYREGCRCEACVALNARNSDKWKDGQTVKLTGGKSGKTIKKTVKSHNRREGMAQLGKHLSTAFDELTRDLLVNFVNKDGQVCHKCGKPVTRDNYTIAHKDKWMEQPFPKSYFFNLKNVCFNHKNCKEIE